MGIYLKIIQFNIKGANAYIHEVFAKFVQQIIPLAFNLILWSLVISSAPNTSQSVDDLVSYYIIAGGLGLVLMVRYGRFGSNLRKTIIYGKLNNYITKPVNELWHIYSETLGSFYIMYLCSIIFVITGIIIQLDSISVWGIVFFMWSLINAYFINISFNILDSGITSLLTTESNGLRTTMGHFVAFLSGFMVPLYFFPDTIRTILNYTPFPHMLFNVIDSLKIQEFSWDRFILTSVGSLWAVFLMVIIIFIWNKLLKRYEGVGI